MTTSPQLPQDAVELYLRGELDKAQLTAFEQQLQTDAALKAELAYHKDLQEGFKAFRHAELKALLQETQIPAAPFWTNSWFQWAAAGTGALALLVTAYLFKPQENTVSSETPVATQQSQSMANQLPPSEPPMVNGAEPVMAEPVVSEPQHTSSEAPAPKAASKGAEAKESTQPSATFAEPSAQPLEVVADAPKTNAGTSNPAAMPAELSKTAPAVTETIIKSDADKTLRYQFIESKLYLYGKFDGLYEVIDLNEKTGKRSFLYYANNYYPILPGTSKITNLEPTSDKLIISTLGKLRSK